MKKSEPHWWKCMMCGWDSDDNSYPVLLDINGRDGTLNLMCPDCGEQPNLLNPENVRNKFKT